MSSKEPKEKHPIYIRLIVVAGVIFGFCVAECKESAVETKPKLQKIKSKLRKIFSTNTHVN